MNLKTIVQGTLIYIFIGIIALIIYLVVTRTTNTKENVKVLAFENVSHGYKLSWVDPERPANILQLKEIKERILLINEHQYLTNRGHYPGLKFDPVLVTRVKSNITYLAIFLESVQQIEGINKSLLIFAHDVYNEDIIKLIAGVRCARVLQMFYPYSVQLHPTVYPGEDKRFCEELLECEDSRKRDPSLVQGKLFWWWMLNQVFDNVGVLKNYNGYIYLLDTEMYLMRDFMLTAKLLELMRPELCAKCRFLSLGAQAPVAKLYRPLSSTFVISVWGWSNYSNSGFGFNRTTWNVIKGSNEQFCYFKDPSWENSLKYVGTNTYETSFYMFYIEAPRFFPTSGCGAFRGEGDCGLQDNYRDIVDFLPRVRYRQRSFTYSIINDAAVPPSEVQARGLWGDARDVHLCMFLSGHGRRIYY